MIRRDNFLTYSKLNYIKCFYYIKYFYYDKTKNKNKFPYKSIVNSLKTETNFQYGIITYYKFHKIINNVQLVFILSL